MHRDPSTTTKIAHEYLNNFYCIYSRNKNFIRRSLHYRESFFATSSGDAGIMAPSGALFLPLNSSHICSIVTHSTPSCLLIYSIILTTQLVTRYNVFSRQTYLSCISKTCGLPDTSGWIVIGKMNSSNSR